MAYVYKKSDVWTGFSTKTSDNGSIEFIANDTAVRIVSNDSASNKIMATFAAIPGAHIECTFSARIVESTSPAKPWVSIDYPTDGDSVQRIDLTEEWKDYSCSFTVPFDSVPGVFETPTTTPGEAGYPGSTVQFVWGLYGNISGIIEVTRPLFTTKLSPFDLNMPDIYGSLVFKHGQNDKGRYTLYYDGRMEIDMVIPIRAEDGPEGSGGIGIRITTVDWPIPFVSRALPPYGGIDPACVTLGSYDNGVLQMQRQVIQQFDETTITLQTETDSTTLLFAHIMARGYWKDIG